MELSLAKMKMTKILITNMTRLLVQRNNKTKRTQSSTLRQSKKHNSKRFKNSNKRQVQEKPI